MKRQIPNILTVIRFLLVPLFLYFVFISQSYNRISIALAIFIVASFTDYLDGMLARRMNVISDFGKIMDPLADKLLVLSALTGLCWLPPFRLPQIIFYVILLRELLITILREIYQKKGIVIAADKLGKLKTVMQMLGIIAAYAMWAFMTSIATSLVLIISLWFWLVVAITLISGLNYFLVLFPRRKP